MVAATSTCSRSLWLLAASSLLRGTDHSCLRTSLTTRRICRMATDRPHDSTSALDDGRTSTHPLGRAVSADSLRTSSSFFDQWNWAISIVQPYPPCSPLCVAPGLLLVS